jgi:ketosteroid isomerase-like protein
VTLANPFGPPKRGWEAVSEALELASARFSEGEVGAFDTVAIYVAGDLASLLELETWKAKVDDGEEIAPFVLRVSTTLRREGEDWRIVHRHADPIGAADPNGPPFRP